MDQLCQEHYNPKRKAYCELKNDRERTSFLILGKRWASLIQFNWTSIWHGSFVCSSLSLNLYL